MRSIALNSGAWLHEQRLELPIPVDWRVVVHAPRCPAPLSDTEIASVMARPHGRPPLADLCRGKRRPVIVVDDVNRPTPIAYVLPSILNAFAAASVPLCDVTVLMAGGSHGAPPRESVVRKIGEAAMQCRVVVHDAEGPTTGLGRTAAGTPVWVNPIAAEADLLIGIGGLYPNQSAGFGGGSKLALGILGLRSIAHLHYLHRNAGWGHVPEQDAFRRDLDEIARMIRLDQVVILHSNADKKPVRIAYGDPVLIYAAERVFVREVYQAAPPGEAADVVIANAYPCDLTLTFALMKGFHVLRTAPSRASRIGIAACGDGMGLHRLFPLCQASKTRRLKQACWKFAAKGPQEVLRQLREKAARATSRRVPHANPVHVYRPGMPTIPLPIEVSGMHVTDSWPAVLAAIRHEQGGKPNLDVVVYQCAPMQVVVPGAVMEDCQCQSSETYTAPTI